MTVEEKVGQLVQVRVIEESDGMPAAKTREMIQAWGVGSVIYYGLKDPAFTAHYTNQLQEWARATRLGVPLLVAADLETGLGYHVRGATVFPQQMGVAATGDVELARTVARLTAREARAVGTHWIYSPLADVNVNASNPVIGVRAFGDSPEQVGAFVRAYVEGYEQAGVLATPKHYPGHGDTAWDSHLTMPRVGYDLKTLRDVHLRPFADAFRAGASAVMTAHILVEAVDARHPATLSAAVLTGLLRREQGFEGIVVTDAMSMGGIAGYFGVEQAATLAVRAGADVVMATGSFQEQRATCEALVRAVREGEIPPARLDESVHRVLAAKLRLGLLEKAQVDPVAAARLVGAAEHQGVALDAARRSVTLVLNEGPVLPLSRTARVVVTGALGARAIAGALGERGVATVFHPTPAATWNNRFEPSEAEVAEAVHLAAGADAVVVTTYSSYEPPLAEGQVRLVNAVAGSGRPVIVVSVGLPYDVSSLPQAHAFVATYALNRWGYPRGEQDDFPPTYARAVAEVLVGELAPVGRLPVSIPGTRFQRGWGLSFSP